jgi:hypothetical protein
MLSHKFHVRQLVQLNPSISRNVPRGSYEITKKLPERVARESELSAV